MDGFIQEIWLATIAGLYSRSTDTTVTPQTYLNGIKIPLAMSEQSSRFHWIADWGNACPIRLPESTCFSEQRVLVNLNRSQ